MKFYFTHAALFFILLCSHTAVGQSAGNSFTVQKTLEWADKPLVQQATPQSPLRESPYFKGASFGLKAAPTLPFLAHRFALPSQARIAVEILDLKTTPLSTFTSEDLNYIAETPQFEVAVSEEREKYFGNVRFVPLVRRGGQIEKIIDYTLRITYVPQPTVRFRGPFLTTTSALREGDIYKFSIKETGVVRLDYEFLKNTLKISNIDQIDPRTIKILGNGGGLLPEPNVVTRPDDVVENAVFVSGEADGKFDAGDFILFYGIASDRWLFDAATQTFTRPKNIYDDEAFYFVKISAGNGLRIENQASLPNGVYTSTVFNDYARIEDEKVNLLAAAKCNCSQGSGKLWVGDFFGDGARERTYNFPLTGLTDSARFYINFIGQSEAFSSFEASIGGRTFRRDMTSSNPSAADATIASDAFMIEKVPVSGDNLSIKISYPSVLGASSNGYLDFLELNIRRALRFSGTQFSFRDVRTLSAVSSTFSIQNGAGATVWDITEAQRPKLQAVSASGQDVQFSLETATKLREFVIFNNSSNFIKPAVAVGKIANQNLHGIDNVDYVVVYHSDFEAAAKRLANHRQQQNGMSVAAVELGQIYNEFSNGSADAAAIRDFARMLHKRNPTRFKYMVLVGDGSYDYKRINPLTNLQASDFIPPYESTYSFNPISSYPSDDFYALLSDTEGGGDLIGDLDIGVGRLPVRTMTEAEAVVSKIIDYETSYGDWRNRTVAMADDEDGNTHINDADYIADEIRLKTPVLNTDKLYVDAYRLDVSSGGTRVPDMEAAINENQFKGMLVMSYLGHGGPKGLAQERVLMRETLESWRNRAKLPVLVTATCSFSGYDNPKETSAGEAALLNAQGGAVALFSTVRAVYASANFELTKAVFDTIFTKENNRALYFGDIFTRAKNTSGSRSSDNNHKFTLLGDPATRLALPRYRVGTTKVNGRTVSATVQDTFRALQKMTIEGVVVDDNGQIMTNFNGTIYPTVFDKPITLRTLGQNRGSQARNFTVQRNIIFKGAATATNGRFSFSFTIPKDIDYSFGNGKISYYATDNNTDASGTFEGFIIGGTDTNRITDNTPPRIEVYMNDENFVFGGITDPSPTLYVKLSDDNGINISGTSIGHDLSASLDKSNNRITLNNFYQAVKDDPTKGTVRYPLSKLALGRHSISVKAWDISNNPAEGYTEFVVADNGKAALAHVLNYPNPFSTRTNFQFEHNLAGQNINVRINIYTISGRLIKTLEAQSNSDSYRIDDIEWDGKDDFGNILARGVYVYKIKITGLDIRGKKTEAESNFEKLVIIK